MARQFTTADHLRIAYLEKNVDQKQTLLFVHGNSCSSASWHKQFAAPELDQYRLIAIDLPAHGQSDDSAWPEKDYNLRRLGEITSLVVKALNIREYILIGVSLGANIVAEAMAYGLKPQGIVLIGPSILGAGYPMSDFVIPDTAVSVVFSDDAPSELVNEYAATTSLSTNPDDRLLFLNDYYHTRVPFRSAFFRSITEKVYTDEIQLLKESALPLCIIMGADEKIIRPDYLDNAPFDLWPGHVHKIAGASHLVHIDKPDDVNRLIADYAENMFK